jgi:hypothetical protein
MIRQANLEGHRDERASRVYTIATGARLSPAVAEEVLNPLDENGGEGFSPDTWGYRRPSIVWPASETLPSPYAGAVRWLLDPRKAVEAAGLTSSMPACR